MKRPPLRAEIADRYRADAERLHVSSWRADQAQRLAAMLQKEQDRVGRGNADTAANCGMVRLNDVYVTHTLLAFPRGTSLVSPNVRRYQRDDFGGRLDDLRGFEPGGGQIPEK